jgi:hypothetical protein
LTIIAPSAVIFTAIVNFLETRGIAFSLLDLSDQTFFVESRVILDSHAFGLFPDLSQSHLILS